MIIGTWILLGAIVMLLTVVGGKNVGGKGHFEREEKEPVCPVPFLGEANRGEKEENE